MAAGAVFTAEDGAPFSRGDLYSFIVNKTQALDDGGAYYADDGTLRLQMKGKTHTGSWSTRKTGELCWHVYDLGDVPCQLFLHDNGGVRIVRAGEPAGQPVFQDGNTLVADDMASVADETAQPKNPQKPDWNFFSRQETIAFLAGKTSMREPGGRMYYAPDFTLHTNWNGVRKTGTWRVNDDGAVCWEVVGWGPTPCEFYFRKTEDGILWARFRGRDTAAAEHVDGDRTTAD